MPFRSVRITQLNDRFNRHDDPDTTVSQAIHAQVGEFENYTRQAEAEAQATQTRVDEARRKELDKIARCSSSGTEKSPGCSKPS